MSDTSDSRDPEPEAETSAGSHAQAESTDMNERAEQNLERGEVDGRPPLEAHRDYGRSVTEGETRAEEDADDAERDD